MGKIRASLLPMVKTTKSKCYAYIQGICKDINVAVADFLRFMSLLSGEKEVLTIFNFYDFVLNSLKAFSEM